MRHHQDWLHAYLEHTADTEPPESYRFWAGVSTIASVLRRKVYFDMKDFYWTPNFFIIFVAPPGIAGKSTTIRAAKLLSKDIPGVKFGPSVMTWQSLPKILRSNIEMVQGREGQEVTAPITFTASELGALIDPRDKGMIDVLVDIWDSADGTWEKMTKVSGDDKVFNPWINLIAGTTPSWLMEHYPRHMAGGGFTSRCIFVYADRKQKIIAYPMDFVDERTEGVHNSLITDLRDINTITGRYQLTPEAHDWGKQWHEETQQAAMESSLSEDQYYGWISRKQSHVHKLAMVMAAAQSSELVINLRVFRAAERLISAIEPDIERIFSTIHNSRAQEGSSRLLAIVRQRGPILKGTLYRLLFISNYMNVREFEESLDSARTAGFIALKVDQTNGQIYVCVKEVKK